MGLYRIWISSVLSVVNPSDTTPFEAPKFGVKVAIPTAWPVAVRERDEYVFVAKVPQGDPDRPGAAACELGLAPESLEEYRTRIEGSAKRGDRPGTLVNEAPGKIARWAASVLR